VAAWREAVNDGSARAGAWPGFINIPSKIGQVSAVRTLARQRYEQDTNRCILLAAVCPGMMNTPTSAEWWDVSDAPTPAQADRSPSRSGVSARQPPILWRAHPQRRSPIMEAQRCLKSLL
jgi:NAD(P)-dependent dehydrogenase (short-subunit alcohol dehydrogenase family)